MLELQKGSKLAQALGKCSSTIENTRYLIRIILCFQILARPCKIAQLAICTCYRGWKTLEQNQGLDQFRARNALEEHIILA